MQSPRFSVRQRGRKMFIIPIGTKSTLALKPKVTIILIAICITVHILTSISGGRVVEGLISVHPGLYANQVHLYLLENPSGDNEQGYVNDYQLAAITRIRHAKDYITIENGIYTALGGSCGAIGKLEEFGDVLLSRDDSFYAGSREQSDLFADWKTCKGEEDEVLSGLVTYSFGLVPGKMHRFWTFITHLFLHSDIWHLLGNMLFLWIVGCLLEDSWGRLPFLAFYLAGGIFAGWAHCLQDPSSVTPLIGASGAIAAAMGAFTIRHFMTKIKFFYFFMIFFRPFWGNFFLPAFIVLPFWFIQQVALKSMADFVGGSEIAYLAHIAGYMAGIITALTVKATGMEKKWLNPMVEKNQIREGVLKAPLFNKACDLLQNNNIERARTLFLRLLAENPEDLVLARDITTLYGENRLFDECRQLGEKTLRNLILKKHMEEASNLAFELTRYHGEFRITSQPLMRVGKWLTEQSLYGEAHDIYRYIIKLNESPIITAKTSIVLAKLLEAHLNNPVDACHLLEEVKQLDLDPALLETVTDIQARMGEMSERTCQT